MGLFKNARNKIKKAANRVSSSVQNTVTKVKRSVQNTRNRQEDRFDKLRDKLEDRIDNVKDSGAGVFNSVKDKFEDLDINGIMDRYLDDVRSNLPKSPVQPPLPDLSDVENAVEPSRLNKIVEKLTQPIDPDRAADLVTDQILNEIEDIIKSEGNNLWRERLEEYGVFSEVIEYIDDQLELQRQIITNTESVIPPEDANIPTPLPNDARHQLIQPDEQTNLYTPGKELWDPINQVVYTGEWHTRKTKSGLIALSGATFRKGDSRTLQLIPSEPEVALLEQVDITISPLDIEYETTPITSYGSRDASITLKIDDGTPPYTIDWFRADETGVEKKLNSLTNKLVIDNLPYGKYTARIGDSYIKEEQIDLRNEQDTTPNADAVKRLMDIIIDRESRYNIDTQGWEFAINGVPYMGKVHFSEMPIDIPVEDQSTSYIPVKLTDNDVRETKTLFDEYAEKIYDEIMQGTNKAHRLSEFFKPHQKFTEVAPKLERPPRKSRISLADAFDGEGPKFGSGLIDKIRERRKLSGGVFGGLSRRPRNLLNTNNDRFNRTDSSQKNNRRGGSKRNIFGRR